MPKAASFLWFRRDEKFTLSLPKGIPPSGLRIEETQTLYFSTPLLYKKVSTILSTNNIIL